MSADNWRVCPKCLARAKAHGTEEPEEWFREDFEIGMSLDGKFYVSYHGRCRGDSGEDGCGFHFDFKYENIDNVQVEKPKSKLEADLEQLESDLISADCNDETLFHLLVQRCWDVLNISDSEIADSFGMSVPSVKRWRNGCNAPHPAMRPHVYKFFASLCHLRRFGEKL